MLTVIYSRTSWIKNKKEKKKKKKKKRKEMKRVLPKSQSNEVLNSLSLFHTLSVCVSVHFMFPCIHWSL